MPLYLPLHWHQDMVPLKKFMERSHTVHCQGFIHIFIFSQLAGCLVQSGLKPCLVKCLQDANNLVRCFFGSKKSLWHSILFQKLKFCGVRFQRLARFKSHLTGQNQKTLVDGERRDFCTSTCGIPQGINSWSTVVYFIHKWPFPNVNRTQGPKGLRTTSLKRVQPKTPGYLASWSEFRCKQNSATA